MAKISLDIESIHVMENTARGDQIVISFTSKPEYLEDDVGILYMHTLSGKGVQYVKETFGINPENSATSAA